MKSNRLKNFRVLLATIGVIATSLLLMEPAKAAQPALTGLSISQGTLTPAFNPSITSYSALVPASISSVTVIPVGVGDSITVSGVPTVDLGVSVSAPIGQRTLIPIVSTANGLSITYTVNIAHNAGLVPTFSGKITADGIFTFGVTNYDPNYSWSVQSSVGSASIDSSGKVTVTGIPQGVAGTVTVTSNRADYEAKSASIVSDVIPVVTKAALTPTFSTPVATANGFTVNFSNYDNAFNFVIKTSAGMVTPGTAIGSIIPLTVTGLTVGQSATVSVTTSRVGYFNGSGSVTGNAILGSGLTPTFSIVTPTPTGFNFNVTNFDPTYSFTVTTSSGTSAKGTASGSSLPITISGLAAGQSASVTVTASKAGTATVSSSVSGVASVGNALTPTFGTPTPTSAGFNVSITNFDSKFSCTATSNSGSANISSTGAVSVTGLMPGSSATVNVKCSRAGYLDGSGQVTSSAQIGLALTPVFGPVSYNPSGFSIQISNYDPKFTWNLISSVGSSSINGSGLITINQVAPSVQANLTLATTRAGFSSGTASKSIVMPIGAALNPILGPAISTPNGFSVSISNFDSAFQWDVVSSPGSATVDQNGLVSVTNVSSGMSSTLTVRTSRAGYGGGSATTRGNALAQTVAPTTLKSTQPSVQANGSKKLPTATKGQTSTKSTTNTSKKAIIITCAKGTIVRRIVGYSPICPAGYVRKG